MIGNWKPRKGMMLAWLGAVLVFWHIPGVFGWLTGGAEAGASVAMASFFDNPLASILSFVGYLSTVGLSMIAYTLRPEVVTVILNGGNGEIVYVVWTMVRDLLNLAFILILLFSAFATIFQVEKYNLRSILLRLVLMAVFVNFSLPIARVIVDASNIIMYYFVNVLFAQAYDPGIKIGVEIVESLNIAELMLPSGAQTQSTTVMIFAILFTLIVAVLTIAIAGILVVRLVVLAILIIFSPIAFVANILPSTQNFASSWWDNLFKYAFVGPILIFFLFFSTVFMSQLHDMAFMKDNSQGAQVAKNATKLTTTTKNIGAAEQDYLATIAFNLIPIIILYMGIMSSMKMGGMAGTWAAGKAGGVVMGAGNMIRRGAWGGTKYVVGGAAKEVARYADDRTYNIVSGAANRISSNIANRKARRDAEYQSRVGNMSSNMIVNSSRRAAAQTKQLGKEAAEASKELEYMSNIDLDKVLDDNKSTYAQKVAAGKMLADRGALNTVDKLNKVVKVIGHDRKAVKIHEDITASLKKNNQRMTLAEHHATGGKHYDQKTGKWNTSTAEKAVKDYLDLSVSNLAKQNLRDSSSGINNYVADVIEKRVKNNRDVAEVYKSDDTNSIQYIKNVSRRRGGAGLDWA